MAWLRDTMAAEGKISPEDLDLFQVTDDPQEVAAKVAFGLDQLVAQAGLLLARSADEGPGGEPRPGPRDPAQDRQAHGHREQGHGDPLPRGQQHVELAGTRLRRHLERQVHQLVRGVAHGRDDHDHLIAGGLRGHDSAGDALDALRVRDRRTAELLYHPQRKDPLNRCRRLASGEPGLLCQRRTRAARASMPGAPPAA